jgi:hypothetical protein
MQGPQFELDAQQPQSLIYGPCLGINMPHRTLVWDVPLITALAVGTRQKATSICHRNDFPIGKSSGFEPTK